MKRIVLLTIGGVSKGELHGMHCAALYRCAAFVARNATTGADL